MANAPSPSTNTQQQEEDTTNIITKTNLKNVVCNNESANLRSSTLATITITTDTTTNTTKTYPTWHNFVSGGVAGAGSRIFTAPLDLIRIRRQLIVTYPTPSFYEQITSVIRNEGGISGLYRGNMAAMYLWVSYASVQFTIYNSVKDTLTKTNNNNYSSWYWYNQLCSSPTAISFVSGAVAGLVATVVTYPFDVCRTTFAARPSSSISSTSIVATTKRKRVFLGGTTGSLGSSLPSSDFGSTGPRTMIDFSSQLYKTKGINGFYAGCFPAMIQIVPYMGLNFTIYDRLIATSRSTTANTNDAKGTTATTSIKASVSLSAYAGSISGSVSKIIIYPIDTIKRRLQAQAFFGGANSSHQYQQYQYTGMMDCFYKVVRYEGFQSLYRGIVPSVLKTAISSSLTFGLYQFSKHGLETIHDYFDCRQTSEQQPSLYL